MVFGKKDLLLIFCGFAWKMLFFGLMDLFHLIFCWDCCPGRHFCLFKAKISKKITGADYV